HTRSTRDWSSDVCSSDLSVVERERHLRMIGAERRLPEREGATERGERAIVLAQLHHHLAHVVQIRREVRVRGAERALEDRDRTRSEERRVGKAARTGAQT